MRVVETVSYSQNMKKTLIVVLVLVCSSCVSVKRARPPDPAIMATEWLGFCGCEIFYLALSSNGTGTCVYMFPNESSGSVSTVTDWKVTNFTISISCKGVTYPEETIRITGHASGSSIDANIHGSSPECPWQRKGTLRRVDDILREISVGRKGTEMK